MQMDIIHISTDPHRAPHSQSPSLADLALKRQSTARGRSANGHDWCADADTLKKIDDIFIEHTDAAIRGGCAD